MTNAKHTQGPWVAVNNGNYWEITPSIRADNDPFTIGDVCASEPSNPRGGLQEANARLIAAAPDLLEALKALLSDDMNGMNERDIAAIERDRIYGRCLSALAKAEGRA